MTKIGLMDTCIDGDREKFDLLIGDMFDQFSYFFRLLQQNGVSDVPKEVNFTKSTDVAEFDISAEISLDTPIPGAFNCSISAIPSKQATKIQVERST